MQNPVTLPIASLRAVTVAPGLVRVRLEVVKAFAELELEVATAHRLSEQILDASRSVSPANAAWVAAEELARALDLGMAKPRDFVDESDSINIGKPDAFAVGRVKGAEGDFVVLAIRFGAIFVAMRIAGEPRSASVALLAAATKAQAALTGWDAAEAAR